MATFAIFQSGGKQYRAKVGDVLKLEKLTRPVAASGAKAAVQATDTVEFDQVLMLDDKVGAPHIAGAKVIGTVLEQTRGDKILVFKKKRRHNYRRTKGHRQHITVVKITEIKG